MKSSLFANKLSQIIGSRGVFVLLIFMVVNSYSANRQKLTYSIELDEEKWNSFYISITIEHNMNEHLLCTMPSWAPGIYYKAEFYLDIADFKVVGEATPEVQAEKLNDYSWLIEAGKNDVIIISYKIKRKKDAILGECIGKDFALINGATMFMHIRELDDYPINLVVSVPYGWQMATDLLKAAEDFEYTAVNYYELIQHPIYIGTFSDIYFSFPKGDGYILLDGPKTFDVNRLSIIARQIVTYQTFLLIGQPLDRYFFIFKVFPFEREISSLSFQNSSIFYVPASAIKDDLNLIGKLIASNFFKRWFGPPFLLDLWHEANLIFIPRTRLLWFTEGICDYYGSLSMIRAGFWSQDDFIRHYIKSINQLLRHPNYLNPSLVDLSYNILENNYAETEKILKLKGELVCLLMDLKIRDATNNLKNIDDVVRFIKSWFLEQQRPMQYESLLNTLNGVASIDFTNFFDLYVYGDKELPFEELFERAGFILEAANDTIADLGKIILDETNRVIQLSKSSPLFLAGLKIDDQILAVKGIKCQGNHEFNQIIDSLKVGSETEITIRREGLSLVIGAHVSGKEVKVMNLKAINETVDRANAIRESWLSGRRIVLEKTTKGK